MEIGSWELGIGRWELSSPVRQFLELRDQFQGLTRCRVVHVNSSEPLKDLIIARRWFAFEAAAGRVGWRHE